MPTSPPQIEAVQDPGFTLIEMLVVLSILALLATIAASNLSRRPGAVDAAHDRTRLAAAIDEAQAQASTSATAVPLRLDTLFGADRVAFQPSLYSAAPGMLIVYPDGSNTGGRVTIGDTVRLDVDWLSGEVRDADR